MDNNNQQQEKALKTFSPLNISLAILAGLIGTGILLYDSLEGKTFNEIVQELANPSWFWIVLSVLVLLIRDAGYTYRIKNLTDGKLTWKGSLYVIILWEFASAVTPSVVGGTAVAIFLLNKEGLNMGKSIAYVMLTAILDNLFFIIASPIVLATASEDFLSQEHTMFGQVVTLNYVFYFSYSLIAVYTLFMAFGVLFNPRMFQKIITGFTNFFHFSGRIKRRAYRLSIDVITASRELKGKSFTYWLKAGLSTVFVWSARYFIVNCLIAAFKDLDLAGHFDTFSKHVILWVSQLVAVTPGGSGFAEYFFQELMGVTVSIAILWRILTYYGYLAIGSIALPRWLKRVLVK